METALIIIGVLALVAVLVWGYSYLSDAKIIDQEEETQVRAETPSERERARFDEAAAAAEHNAADIDLYSKE